MSVFWDIPYAAAPVGPGRFAAPAAPLPWTGARDAGAPGPTAPAALRAGFGPLDLSALLGSRWVTGQDYLSVNVWTPSPYRDRLPVMVYVHGGGFLNGSGRAALYDGTGFARGGVVLVTLNYAYLFRWRSTAFGGSLGACHCAELPFVFDRTGVPGLRGPQALLGDGDLPSDLASHMYRAWTGFAATGDPGWAPYRPGEDRTVQVIDERWRPAHV